jgi:hypothetical protein
MVWILNTSFKKSSQVSVVNKLEIIDTINKSNLPLYADTTLYSGFMGNFELVRNQILNGKRIDSLLKTPVPVYYALTKEDRKQYIFSIDQNTIKKAHDTTIFRDKELVINIPLKFTNYSNDTLEYLSMDCTWLDYFFTDNKRIEFAKQICFKNVPCVDTIPPHHTINIYIPIVLKRNVKIIVRKFRIGMSLQKYIDHNELWDFDPFKYFLRVETSNMIWSNQVQLP